MLFIILGAIALLAAAVAAYLQLPVFGAAPEGERLARPIPTAVPASAREILCDVVRRVTIEGPARAWTVLHAGIDPRLGLDRSSDEVKWSIKARPGETAWWEQYEGQDGLLVFGHKPLDAPLRRTIDRAPIAVNVDTGCVEGGPLTAYLVRADRFLSVESEVLSGSRVASGCDGRVCSTGPA